jgi:hypothetical protein
MGEGKPQQRDAASKVFPAGEAGFNPNHPEAWCFFSASYQAVVDSKCSLWSQMPGRQAEAFAFLEQLSLQALVGTG